MAVRGTKPAFSVREDLKELQRPIAPAGNSLLTATTPQDAFGLIGAGRRNMIINGKFQVSQRGTYTSSTNTTSNAYYLDRWYWNGDTSGTSIQHKLNQTVNGYTVNTFYCTSNSASYIVSPGQQIESNVWGHLKGKEVTLSAWVKTNNPKVGFRIYTGGQNYGPRHSGSGHWEYLTWTFRIPTDAISLYPLIDSYINSEWNATSNTYVEFTMVQLEEGTIATPFEHRSYAEELRLCQRYFYRIYGGRYEWKNADFTNYKNGSLGSGVHPVAMRTAPTMSHNLTGSSANTNPGSTAGAWSWYKWAVGYGGSTNMLSATISNWAFDANETNWTGGIYYFAPSDYNEVTHIMLSTGSYIQASAEI